MKKWLCFLMIFVLTLGTVGCTDQPSVSEDNDGDTETSSESDTDAISDGVSDEPSDEPSDKPSDEPNGEEPKENMFLTWDKINAIPVATGDMSTDELRQICLDYMKLQLTFQWHPDSTFSYTINSMSKRVDFFKEKLYGGLPYDSPCYYGSLYIAVEYFDPETGILGVSGMTGDTLVGIIGNHCSGACLWAWGRVSNSMQYWDATKGTYHYATLTDHMTVPHGFLPVGPYEASETTVNWSDNDGTSVVCNANGEQVMYESYAAMLPADGVVTNYLKSNGKRTGHCKMIEVEPVVVRNSDGTINGSKSYVLICEQADEYRQEELPDGTDVIYQGAVMRKTTFKELWQGKYVPFTLAEFQGKDAVEKSQGVMVYGADSEPATLSTLVSATLVTNYAIAKVDVTITDEDGNVLYSKSKMPGVVQCFSMSMSKLIESWLPESLEEGMTITVGARISTGEYIEGFRYTVT